MRTTALVTILLLLGTAFGQQAGQSPFSPEEGQQLGLLQKGLQDAFEYKEYEKALGLLSEMNELLGKGISRVESGEVDVGDKKEPMLNQLSGMLANNHYNQACCLSMTGKKPDAVAALEKAIALGWMDVDHMKLDTDLDPIREEAAYKAILAKLAWNDVIEIHAPEGLADPAPLVIALHPLESSEKSMLEKLAPVADANRFVLAVPRGPISVAKDSFSWRRNSDDEEAAIRKILAAVAAGRKGREITKVFLLGLGEGGYFASLAALAHPDRIDGAIPINAFWNKYYFADFFEKAKAHGARIFFIHGKDDPFFGKTDDALKQLGEAGIPANRLAIEGKRKDLPEDLAGAVKQALTFLLSTIEKGGASPQK
jgi:pimeloyl-ACP methyl ester carboxylesterase